MRLPSPRALTVTATLLAALVLLPERAQVVSATTGVPLEGVHLGLPWAYLLLAPITSTLDYLTLLTPRRHVLVLCTLFAAYAIWRTVRLATLRPTLRPTRRRTHRRPMLVALEAGKLVLFTGVLAAFYGFGGIGPRPMAHLVVDDPDLVAIDFHSHSEASHDARAGFTVARLSEWHRSAGFHVMYLTDHDSTRAAIEVERTNPAVAGDGLVAFSGREVVFRNEHVIALGTDDPREWEALPATSDPCIPMPLLIQTIPEDLSRVPLAICPDGTGGVQAIELVDGDPRGLAQGARDRASILSLADSLGLAIVASSNLHGWGRTASGWSLMRVPGWRAMTPAQLSARIEADIRTHRTTSVVPVIRRIAYTRSHSFGPAAAMMLPIDGFTLLSRSERVAWILWTCLVLALLSTRNRRGGRDARSSP